MCFFFLTWAVENDVKNVAWLYLDNLRQLCLLWNFKWFLLWKSWFLNIYVVSLGLYFFLFLFLNWSIVDIQYCVDFRCTAWWLDIHIHYESIATVNLGTTCHQSPQCCWLYSLWYPLHPVTYFITESLCLLIFHLCPTSPTTTAVSLSLSLFCLLICLFFFLDRI